VIDHETLFKDGVHLGGFAVNRVHAVLNLGARGEAVEDADSGALVEPLC